MVEGSGIFIDLTLFAPTWSAIDHRSASSSRGSLLQRPFDSCSRKRHLPESQLSTALFQPQFTLSHTGIGLADYRLQALGGTMTRAQWLLLGAVGLGVAIVIYLVFFCPADCQ